MSWSIGSITSVLSNFNITSAENPERRNIPISRSGIYDFPVIEPRTIGMVHNISQQQLWNN